MVDASIIRVAFSPIMIDGSLVLPEVSVGMIEASATQPRQAADTKLVVDHRHRVRAHLAGERGRLCLGVGDAHGLGNTGRTLLALDLDGPLVCHANAAVRHVVGGE